MCVSVCQSCVMLHAYDYGILWFIRCNLCCGLMSSHIPWELQLKECSQVSTGCYEATGSRKKHVGMLVYWYPVRVYLKIEYSQDHHLNQLKIIIFTLKYALFGSIPVYRCTTFLHSVPFCGSNKTSPSVDVRKWRPPERKISWDTQMPQVTGYHFLRLV